MPQPKKKLDLLLPATDVAAFLRTLADEMERGEIAVGGEEMDLENYRSLKVSLKNMGENTRVRVKVKYPRTEALDYVVEYAGPVPLENADAGAGADAAEGGTTEQGARPPATGAADAPAAPVARTAKPKYKSLKKTMGAQFKALKAAVAAGRLPDMGLARVFDHNGRVMCTYAGRGDAYYAVYLAAQDRFMAAMEAGNLAGATAAVAELDRLKKECHDRHK